jgi:aspartate/methionine/tyrosine aminotransferase
VTRPAGDPAARAERPVTFAARVPPHGEINALSRAVAACRARGTPLVDLTDTNPTTAGLPYPEGLLEALADPRGCLYAPHPLGLREAREAIAADAARRGAHVDPDHVVLSASTSEAYSWLFKLLCDPGTSVLVPRPSYPLFEHLTRLEGVRAVAYDLEYHGRWRIDFGALAAAPAGTRAVLIVSPNNPTGSYVEAAELERLAAICRARGWAIVADEVFADYPLDAADPVTDIAGRAGVLAFTLAGASKTLGLPQVKLGWTIVGGPAAERDAALSALEVVADAFLSVGTPVQLAAARLLVDAAPVRAAIRRRTAANLDAARRAARGYPACEVLEAGGGWSAVLRVPATRSEEALALDLVAREGVLVHPGYFFDFPREAFLVLSLLPPEPVFADAAARVMRLASEAP